jgi:multidrug efflux pump subunit AcrB
MAIEADVRGRSVRAVSAEVRSAVRWIADGDAPAAYELAFAGARARARRAHASVLAMLPVSVGLLVLVLVGRLNSFRGAMIAVLAVPGMVVGTVPLLFVTRGSLGLPTLLGMLGLTGIILNSAVSIVQRIDRECADPPADAGAIVTAALERLGPTLATAVLIIAGLLPAALRGGGLWGSMAAAMACGLAAATVLAVFLCPVLYAAFFRIGFAAPGPQAGAPEGEEAAAPVEAEGPPREFPWTIEWASEDAVPPVQEP